MARWVCVVLQAMIIVVTMSSCCRGELNCRSKEGVYVCKSETTKNATMGEVDKNKGEKSQKGYKSVLGDGGMRDERVRVALESWNFCNRAGNDEGLAMLSPRLADCSNIVCSSSSSASQYPAGSCEAEHLVKKSDNELNAGQPFPQGAFLDSPDPDVYVVQKELYLASLCETKSPAGPWHFWMIMLKNGNLDTHSGLCPSTAPPSHPLTSHQHKLLQSLASTDDLGSFPRTLASQNAHTAAEGSSFTRSGLQNAPSKPGVTAPSPHVSPQPFDVASKSSFPCFGHGCMNHPKIYHNPSSIQASTCEEASNVECDNAGAQGPTLSGSFYGTYDLDEDLQSKQTVGANSSYFMVDWSKDPQSGSWLFHHVLRVNHKYPWLMLYLRADATYGLSGGYPWETRGMMIKVPESPNFKVKLTLNVLQGGGSASQFYLLDIGGCWKNNGSECDGNTSTDVTRYSEMIINPNTASWCKPSDLSQCPPYHMDAKTNQRIHRNDTARFPYAAYHLYCVPPNAQFAEHPFRVCDPYSNPQPQELMQLLPHSEWAVHGYPSTKGQGWVGDPTTWTLDVGGLSQRLYFYQDPGTAPAPRKWTSIDVGTEIFISQQPETAEWIVSDFDVLASDED